MKQSARAYSALLLYHAIKSQSAVFRKKSYTQLRLNNTNGES